MSTLLDLRSQIAEDLNRSNMIDVINKAINRAIRYYQSERFWFNETVGSFGTIANTRSYNALNGLPDDILEIDTAKITISKRFVPLMRKTYQYLDSVDTDGFTGYPSIYAWYADSLHLYPIPNDVYTITLSYKKSYPELVVDTDSNDFTLHAEDLIEARAKWWIYKRFLKDAEMENSEKQAELEALEELRSRTSQLVSTYQIRPVVL